MTQLQTINLLVGGDQGMGVDVLDNERKFLPFTYNKLNKGEIDFLLHHPDFGICRASGSRSRFMSTLEDVRNEHGLYYHPDQFFIDLDYMRVRVRSGVEINSRGGWSWKNEIHDTYESLGIENIADLLRVLGQYISVVRHLENQGVTVGDFDEEESRAETQRREVERERL